MNEREKKLAVVVGGILVLFVGFLMFNKVKSGISDRELQITALEQKLNQTENEAKQLQKARDRVYAYTKRSLPADLNNAQSDYQAWLHGELVDAGLAPEIVRPERVQSSKQKDFDSIAYHVIADGDLKELTRFLHSFYTTDHLHRVTKFDLSPSRRDSRELKFDLRFEAIAMKDLDRKQVMSMAGGRKYTPTQLQQLTEKFPIGQKLPERVSKSFEEYSSAIAARNLFSPGNQPPKFADLKKKETTVGEALTFSLDAKDPDNDKLIYELGPDAPAGVEVSQSGKFRWQPEKEGDFEIVVRVRDEVFSPKQDELKFTVSVGKKKEDAPPPKDDKLDPSKLAVVTGFVQGVVDARPKICMHLRGEDAFRYLAEGDAIQIGSFDGVVKSVEVGKNRAHVETKGGKLLRLRLGTILADAETLPDPEL